QTIVQIAAKLSASHHLHEIPIRCSYQPDIHLVRTTAPQALEFLLLQHTQQLRLQRRRDVAYFVQQQRAFVSHFEAPDLLRDGTGEGTLLMTEQFAFQKIQRNGRAIKLYESAPAALTCIVNGVSNEFFSRTGFSLDEDCRVCGSNLLHLVENRFEGSAIANDPIESTFGLVPRRARNCCIICQRYSFQGCYDLIAHISSAARTVLSNN